MEKLPISPILSEANYLNAIEYVADESVSLAKQVLKMELKIDTITIFAHADEEYEFIDNYLRGKGKISDLTHSTTLYVETERVINQQKIKLLGVRKPDPARPEVGYADYPVKNYQQIKNNNQQNQFVTEIQSGNGIFLLELRHPDFDVRGYVFSQERTLND